MKKNFYKVPLYKSSTNIMSLKRAGEIVCYSGRFGVREVVTDKKIAILNILEINNTNSKYTIKIKTKYNLSCKEVLRALVYD